jgi:Flp pilus assembly protein TadD
LPQRDEVLQMEEEVCEKMKRKGHNFGKRVPSEGELVTLLQHYQEGRLVQAESLARMLTRKFPRDQFGWKVLGAVLKATGQVKESLTPMRNSLELEPQDAEAHNNLGAALQELGKLEEAEACFNAAIALKPDYGDALTNLGLTQLEMGRLKVAEESCRRAITCVPEHAAPHFNLGRVLYAQGLRDEALWSFEVATRIEPQNREYRFLCTIVKREVQLPKDDGDSSGAEDFLKPKTLSSNPLILTRTVESDLVTSVCQLGSRALDSTQDARSGSGVCSLDFHFLESPIPVVRQLAKDLNKVMSNAVQSEIFIYDSFFNILKAGGGSTPHAHITQWIRCWLDWISENKNTRWSIICVLVIKNVKNPGPCISLIPRKVSFQGKV